MLINYVSSIRRLSYSLTDAKDEIDGAQRKIAELENRKAGLQKIQRQLDEVKEEKMKLVRAKIDLFVAASMTVNSACVQVREYITMGKLTVVRGFDDILTEVKLINLNVQDTPVAGQKFVSQAVTVFDWLIHCFDGYALGVTKYETAIAAKGGSLW